MIEIKLLSRFVKLWQTRHSLTLKTKKLFIKIRMENQQMRFIEFRHVMTLAKLLLLQQVRAVNRIVYQLCHEILYDTVLKRKKELS